MNSVIRIFFIATAFLVNSETICMQKYTFNDKKPSLVMPCDQWEDTDRQEIAKQLEKERVTEQQQLKEEAPILTITNKGPLAFTVKTNDWTRSIPTKTSIQESCSVETFLEILVGTKITRCQVKNVLNFDEESRPTPTKNELAIAILAFPKTDDISVIINNTYALFLEDTPTTPIELSNESDTSETSSILSIDSPITSPKPQPENYQGVRETRQ